MKDKKKNIVFYQIILLLFENEYVPVSSMAKIMNLSEKNIRSKVDELHSILMEKGLGEIKKVPRKGIALIVEKQKRNSLKNLFSSYEGLEITNGEDRLYTYLRILLSSPFQKITVNEISELTFDSIPVCKRNLAMCEQWLAMFAITMTIKRNYGITLNASEENKRLAIKHLVINDPKNSIEDGIKLFAKGINLELLKTCVLDIENEWNFSFAEESYHSILLYAALAITHCDFSQLKLRRSEKEIVIQYNEYNLSQSLFRLIEERFLVKIPECEVAYFAIQLLCSQMIHSQPMEMDEGLKTYDEKLKQFVNKIIYMVSSVMNVDLSKDRELYFGLLNHIRPAIFRMKFEKHSTANLTSFIQEQYKQTYRVSWTLSVLFEEYYDIQISSTELSYITLYIQASLERVMKPLKIVLITELGMGLNQMFCNKIKMVIPKVNEITIMSLHDFKISSCSDYDLLLTTSNLNIEDPRIIQIESLLSSHGVEMLKEKIEGTRFRQIQKRIHFDVSCHPLFEPNLIIINIEVVSKEELIKAMCNVLMANGYVTKKYYHSVMERELSVSTYIGNGVAIPHGFQTYVNDSKVVVATLKKPLKWNQADEVKVVFMLALRINSAYESQRTQLFYKGFLDLIDSDADIDEILSKDKEELYKFLVR